MSRSFEVIIIGGGQAGPFLAERFAAAGRTVALIERNVLGGTCVNTGCTPTKAMVASAKVAHAAREATHFGVHVGSDTCVHVDCMEGDTAIHGSHVLLAMGRMPNTDDLASETAGVQLDSAGYITVDDKLCTNVSHVWAVGDCNRRGGFTHTAYNDFQIIAANLLDGGDRRVSDRISAHATYTDPPLAQVGMTEEEARATGKDLSIATRPMRSVERAIEKGETFGLMKAIVEAQTECILGATILGWVATR